MKINYINVFAKLFAIFYIKIGMENEITQKTLVYVGVFCLFQLFENQIIQQVRPEEYQKSEKYRIGFEISRLTIYIIYKNNLVPKRRKLKERIERHV